jgi:hypothetical protein
MGLVGVDNNILVMEERHCLAAFKSLKIDVERLLIDPLHFVILICISDLTLFTHSKISVLDLRTVVTGIFLSFTSLVNFAVFKEYSISFPLFVEIN